MDHERKYIYTHTTRYNLIGEAGPGLFPSDCQTVMTDGRGRCRYNVVIEWSGGRSSVIVSTAISFDWNDTHRGNLIRPSSIASELLSSRPTACCSVRALRAWNSTCGKQRAEARVVVGVEVWRLKNGGSRGELFRASFNARSFLGNWSGWAACERRSDRATRWGNRCSVRWERREELMKPLRSRLIRGEMFSTLSFYSTLVSNPAWKSEVRLKISRTTLLRVIDTYYR